MAKMTVNIGIPMIEFQVYLPEPRDFPQRGGEEKLPVLMLLHDYGGDADEWERTCGLEGILQGKRIVVICPSAHVSWYANMCYAWRWQWFDIIRSQLVDYLSRMLPLSDRPEDWRIAGAGMGGYGALLFALSDPGRYSRALALEGDFSVTERYAAGDRSMSLCPDIFEGSEEAAAGKYNVFRLMRDTETVLEVTLGFTAGGKAEEANRRMLLAADEKGRPAKTIPGYWDSFRGRADALAEFLKDL